MHKILITLCSAMLILFTIGCRKDVVVTETETTIPAPEVFYEAGVRGKVVNRDGEIITDATVKWGESTTQTDENGYFSLAGEVAQNAVLTVEKADYFTAIQTITTTNTNIQRTTVQLTPRNLTATLNATNGGEIAVDGGGKVTFAANSFVDENGATYTGNVNVYSTYLDPTIADLHEVMPGNLTAINTEDEMQLLTSFGMINVELEGDAGEALQINQAATLETPVPASILGNAPATIPLWHFNETIGIWEEEGEATLQGDTYIGTVDHFTWWNCDVPTDFILLEGEVNSGVYEPEFTIRITRLSDNTYGITTTDNKGNFAGLVPSDELLLLEILDICGVVIYSQQVGPYTVDTNLGTINVTLSNNDWVELSGNVVDCDGATVSNGYVILSTSNNTTSSLLWLDNAGQFAGLFPSCDAAEIILVAYDLDELKASDPTAFAVASTIDAGTLAACENTVVEGFTFQKNGQEVTWPIINATYDDTGSTFYQFTIIDNSPASGSVHTSLFILDWNSDPTNPAYTFSYENTFFGTSESDAYILDFDVEQLEVISTSFMPGELMQLVMPNVTFTHNGTNETFTSTATVNAIIQ